MNLKDMYDLLKFFGIWMNRSKKMIAENFDGAS